MFEWLWQHVTDTTEDGSCQRDRLLHKEAKNLELNMLHKNNSKNYSCSQARGLFVHLYSNWNALNTGLDIPTPLGHIQWQPLLITATFLKVKSSPVFSKEAIAGETHLSGCKCWKHIANMVFLCKPDLPGSVQLSGDVTLETVIMLFFFFYETYVWARTEHDGGIPKLAKIIGTYFLLWALITHQPFENKTPTISGIPKLDICKIPPLGVWNGKEAWRDVCIHTSPETAFHRHLCVFYTYSITSVIMGFHRLHCYLY